MDADRPDSLTLPDRPCGPLSVVLTRRTLVTLLLGATLTVTTAVYRQRGEGGLPLYRYDQVRRGWRHCTDGVVGGDSRVQRGVSPAVMVPALRARRLVNLAYPHVALTADYLARLDDALDPQSGRRLVVLGVTPASLTATARRLSEFARTRSPTGVDALRAPLDWLFQPFALDALSRALVGRRPRGASYLSPDGWRGATAHVMNAEQEAARLRERADAGRVDSPDPRITAELLAWVRRWTAAGVRVYAFRPPTNQVTVLAENELYRFDEAAFAAAFVSAGGTWLDFPADGYESYDGSHLQGTAAVCLSADLARRIAADEGWPAAPRATDQDGVTERHRLQGESEKADNS